MTLEAARCFASLRREQCGHLNSSSGSQCFKTASRHELTQIGLLKRGVLNVLTPIFAAPLLSCGHLQATPAALPAIEQLYTYTETTIKCPSVQGAVSTAVELVLCALSLRRVSYPVPEVCTCAFVASSHTWTHLQERWLVAH